jgi:hypothetical protein
MLISKTMCTLPILDYSFIHFKEPLLYIKYTIHIRDGNIPYGGGSPQGPRSYKAGTRARFAVVKACRVAKQKWGGVGSFPLGGGTTGTLKWSWPIKFTSQ